MAASNGRQRLSQRALVSMAGGKEDHTFASYIEQRKTTPVVMHPMLLRPVFCTHCRRWPPREELWQPSRSVATTTTTTHATHHVVQLPEPAAGDEGELALEGRCCLRCAREICDKTRYLRDSAPAPSAEGRGGGDTPLHQAAVSRNLTMFCHLITLVGEEGGHGLAIEALRKANDREETALHVAIQMGDRDMVELMLWVDPQLLRIACRDDISPMYLAVSLGHEDIAEALLHASSGTSFLSCCGPNGQNALHAAVLRGEAKMTKLLIDWNKDLATKQDKNRSSPLHFAVSVEQRPCFRFMFYRYTWIKKVPTWKLLDAVPSMAYRADDEGLFPVHIAAMTNQYVAFRILLWRCPGCVTLRDNHGRTFLHVAIQNKAFAVVRKACYSEKCAPIMNLQDNAGNTALHLAVDVQSLGMVFALLMNQNVLLSLRNMKGETALDLARSRIREGFFFAQNPDKVIYNTLASVGAKHGNYQWDRLLENRIPRHQGKPKEDNADDKKEVAEQKMEKEESDKLKDSTQTLAIGSVLVATVTFGASFALPGGTIADDHRNGGSPTLSGSWYFDAFMVANTLAFICSSVATVGLMYSGMAMVTLPFRRVHFAVSLFFASSSVTCLTAAFALGVYMVLAPVARPTAILICGICPLVLIYRNAERIRGLFIVSRPLCVRRGFFVWLMSTIRVVFFAILFELWPFVIIFGWAGHLRERRRYG